MIKLGKLTRRAALLFLLIASSAPVQGAEAKIIGITKTGVIIDVGADAGVKIGMKGRIFYYYEFRGRREKAYIARFLIIGTMQNNAEGRITERSEEAKFDYIVEFDETLVRPDIKPAVTSRIDIKAPAVEGNISETRIPASTDNSGVQKGWVTWGSEGDDDGQFHSPSDIAIDIFGNVYVLDTGNQRIQKFSSRGAFLCKWGSSGHGNGQFIWPQGLAVDKSGYVFVSDPESDPCIQLFSNSGTFQSKWRNRGRDSPQFYSPYGLAVNNFDNVLVADAGNCCIMKMSFAGALLAKWGSKGKDDGQFENPQRLSIDNAGNIYVLDFWREDIQKFSSEGVFLSKGGGSGRGDGQFSAPEGLAIDDGGFVYVADTNNHRIQKFSLDLHFVAKWGTEGRGIWQFQRPSGIAVDKFGYVYVVDKDRIVKFRVRN